MAQHRTCAVHASRRGGQVPGYLGTLRHPDQVPRPCGSQRPPSLLLHLLLAGSRLTLSLVCCAQCLCFINRPSRRPSAVCRNPRTMTMDGWAQRLLTAPCVLRAPWTVGHSVCSPASCSQRCSPGDGPSFMHCTCHEFALRQPAPKPASGTALASVPPTMGPIAIGA